MEVEAEKSTARSAREPSESESASNWVEEDRTGSLYMRRAGQRMLAVSRWGLGNLKIEVDSFNSVENGEGCAFDSSQALEERR